MFVQNPETLPFARHCEADLTFICKKQLAREAYFKYKSDPELADIDTMDLIRKRQNVRQMATTDKNSRALLLAANVPLPELSNGVEEIPINALVALGKKELETLGAKADCYNDLGYTQMLCYAIGTVVDPNIVTRKIGRSKRPFGNLILNFGDLTIGLKFWPMS